MEAWGVTLLLLLLLVVVVVVVLNGFMDFFFIKNYEDNDILTMCNSQWI